jgi:hypothetical protein
MCSDRSLLATKDSTIYSASGRQLNECAIIPSVAHSGNLAPLSPLNPVAPGYVIASLRDGESEERKREEET